MTVAELIQKLKELPDQNQVITNLGGDLVIPEQLLQKNKTVFPPRPYSAVDIAYYILDYYHNRHDPINNIKLQKLLYFVQGYVVKITGKRLFVDDIEMWHNGANVPELYAKLKKYMSEPIYIGDSIFKEAQTIDADHRALIKTILVRTHDKDGWDLAQLIQESETYKETHIADNPHTVLSLDDLKNAEINF